MEGFARLQTWLRLIAVVLLLPAGMRGEEEPPLPTWNVEPPAKPVLPGENFSQLLPENRESGSGDPFYLGNPLLQPQPLLSDDPGLSPHDLSLFLRGGLLGVPKESPQHAPTPMLALKEVPEHVRASLSEAPLNEHLMDPQSLVTEVPAQDLERLLRFHADESRILLYILVLDRDQKLSSAAQIRSLTERLSGKQNVCLAIYPLGEPWRVRLLVSQQIQQACSLIALSEMAEDCITDALFTQEAEQQLQRFAVKLSTRLFQLEKYLPQTITPAAIAPLGFHEVARKGPAVEVVQAVPELSHLQVVVMSGLTVLVLAGGAYALRLWRRFRKSRKSRFVWTLPDSDPMPRLGGAFSGGAGSMIHYGKRDNLPQ